MFLRPVTEALKTLFLFTKSDFKTIIMPVTVFAVATAPLHTIAKLPHVLFWVWFHLLQGTLANQCTSPEEDALNKPNRPIPSGRVTLFQAQLLRWASVPACLALSALYSNAVVKASAALAILLFIYNELRADSNWFTRNVLNGLGLAAFEAGATLVAGHDQSMLSPTAKVAITVSSSIFLTTIHAQDFKDVLGDMSVGRRTIPMIFPVASRLLVGLAMVAWSIGLAVLWNASPLLLGTLVMLAGWVGGRFILFKSVREDQKSYLLYNVWVTFAHILPALSYRVI